MTSAYLLITHGSRDRRPQLALEQLAHLIQQKLHQQLPCGLSRVTHSTGLSLPQPAILLETASLELTPIALSQRIEQLALKVTNLKIIPLFLQPGVHVREDIPREVAIAQQKLTEDVSLKLAPYLGSYQGLYQLLAQQFTTHPDSGKILIAHGSRYPQGNQPIEEIAAKLNALNAYWSVRPSLNDQIQTLVTQGQKTITIVPYFLFTGGITQAIADQVQQLQTIWPQVQLQLGHPLGATPELAQLIVEEIKND